MKRLLARCTPKQFGCVAAALTVLMLVTGCGGGMTIPITVTPDLHRTSSVQVHMIGLNQAELDFWQNRPMSEYWETGVNMARESNRIKVINFSPETSNVQTVDRKDPIWDVWKKNGLTHLVLLANLPGMFTDQPGSSDSRRLILDLHQSMWKLKRHEIPVTIDAKHIYSPDPLN